MQIINDKLPPLPPPGTGWGYDSGVCFSRNIKYYPNSLQCHNTGDLVKTSGASGQGCVLQNPFPLRQCRGGVGCVCVGGGGISLIRALYRTNSKFMVQWIGSRLFVLSAFNPVKISSIAPVFQVYHTIQSPSRLISDYCLELQLVLNLWSLINVNYFANRMGITRMCS